MPKSLADRAVAAAWLGRSGHLPATLLAKGWEKCKVQSEAKTAVLKSSLMVRRARARSQQHKWPQLTLGLRHGLPVSCRSSENSENEAPPNADRSELRERRKHLVAKSVLFGSKPSALGHIDRWHGCGWTRHETTLMLAARRKHNHQGRKKNHQATHPKRLQYL